MKKVKKLLPCILLTLVAIATLAYAYSNIDNCTMPETQGEISFGIPKQVKFKRPVKEYQIKSMRVLEMAASDDTKPVILYLHGGGYRQGFQLFHWKMLAELSKATGCGLVMPDYPLLPNHTALEAHTLVLELYRELTKRIPASRIIIMGDSAGGGFSLALSEEINEQSLPLPLHIVLISPWVDITGGDKSIEEYDNWLHIDELHQFGLSWADGMDAHNPMVSPLYGNMQGLPPTDIFVGTWEVFYPDIVKCNEKLKAEGVNVTLHVGEELGHVYPLYPAPEGEQARRTIAEIVNRSAEETQLVLR
ncbi:alpha/beta hydrolase [Fibrobacter sp. UWB12]|uniref:alpha/beta hydrolase n=1 Tax=Fibrobacter sp. UWB12 TaxID=1896203 RepID=UPI00091577F8|nr:alpha/beta hydrolase [Fibrobacter sp. UWB12]SHK70614.1 Acetyl esterase/lipase [Fibrobacter sp. UWB12]